MSADAKAKFKGSLARVEHYCAKTGVWTDIPLTPWDAFKAKIRRKLQWLPFLQSRVNS